MKNRIKLALIAIATASLLSASRAEMIPGVPVAALGYCQLSSAIASSAAGLSSCAGGIPAGANAITMQSETQNVRYRDDGTAPTASVGMIVLDTASVPQFYTGPISNLKFIAATSGAILDVSFYKVP